MGSLSNGGVKVNKQFFKYLFRKEIIFYLFLFIVYLLAFPMLILFVIGNYKPFLLQIFYIPMVIYIVIAYVLPIWDFRHNYIKKMANFYYSLPIKSENIYKTKTYFHILINIIIFSIAILIGFLVLLFSNIKVNFLYLFILLGLINVIFISTYLFQSFIASRCYSFAEALFLSVAYLALPALIFVSLYFGLNVNVEWAKISFIGQTDYVINYFFNRALSNFGVSFANYNSIFIGLLACLFLHFLTLYRVRRLKIEQVGEKTDSIFAAKLLLPVYLFFILLLGNYTIGWLCLFINVLLILIYFCFNILKYHKIIWNYKLIIIYISFFAVTNLIAFLVVRSI